MRPASSRRAALGFALGATPDAASAGPPPALLRALARPELRADVTNLDPAGPDALLIRRCGIYLDAVNRYNSAPDSGFDDLENDPEWAAILEAEASIDALPPRTLAGVVAKATLASAMAAIEPEYGDPWNSSAAGSFARDITLDLVRLFGPVGAA